MHTYNKIILVNVTTEINYIQPALQDGSVFVGGWLQLTNKMEECSLEDGCS